MGSEGLSSFALGPEPVVFNKKRESESRRDTHSTVPLLVNLPPAGGDGGLNQGLLCMVKCTLNKVLKKK